MTIMPLYYSAAGENFIAFKGSGPSVSEGGGTIFGSLKMGFLDN